MSCDLSRDLAGGSESPTAGGPGCPGGPESGTSSSSADRPVPSSPRPSTDGGSQRLPITRFGNSRQKKTSSVACQTDYTDDYPTLEFARDDPSSSASEGVLRLMIQNFRSMNDTVKGPAKNIHGVDWRIMVMPRQHMVQKKGTQKCLGFFLQCCPDAYSDSWSCQASAELRLISQKQGVPHFTRKTNHNYTSKENDWGYSCFMTWADILDENQGYIKDDRIILEVTVTAEMPKNIVSKEEFEKTIKNWMELAEMQYQRKCIDLAIEANGQALKFCGSRDHKIKANLEKQKAFFIEQKVVESIQRIEKGRECSSKSDDEGLTQTALRQALTSSNARNMARKTKSKKAIQPKKHRASPPNTVRVKDQPSTEKADVVQQLTDITQKIVGGHFNVGVMEKIPYSGAWRHNYLVDQELCNTLYYLQNMTMKEAMQDLQIPNIADRDELLMNLVNCNAPCEDGKIDNEWMKARHMEQLKQINDTVYEIERKRRELIERAKKEAERLNALVYDPEPDTLPEGYMEFQLESLFENGKVDARIEQLTAPLRNLRPPRLLWSDEDSCGWIDEDYISERDSIGTSDEEGPQECAGSPNKVFTKAERERMRNQEIEMLLAEGYPFMDDDEDEHWYATPMVPLCEAGVQTEEKNSPTKEPLPEEPVKASRQMPPMATGRIVKKATSKKKAIAAASKNTPHPNAASEIKTEQQLPVTSLPTAPIPPQPLPILDVGTVNQELLNTTLMLPTIQPISLPTDLPDPLDEMKQPVIPKVLPMEYAMKFFPENMPQEYEYDSDSCKGIDYNLPPDFKSDLNTQIAHQLATVNIEMAQTYPEQVIPNTLSAMANNVINTRKATLKIGDIIQLISERKYTKIITKMLSSLCAASGLHHDTDPDITDMGFPPPVAQLLADVPDDDWATLYAKIINRECESDYIVYNQYLEDVRASLLHFEFTESEEARKFQAIGAALEKKFTHERNTIKDLEKKFDEIDTKMKKSEKTLKTELTTIKQACQAEKERNAALAKDLKEKNKEIKKMEGKNANLMSERDDLQDKVKQLQKDLQASQRKHGEEVQKLKREVTHVNDSRKHLQGELTNREAEMRSLQSQLDERNQIIEKMKHELKQERQKTSAAGQAASVALERAKAAEIEKITYELEAGVALLERAHSDASKHAKEMEEAANTRARNQTEMNNYNNNKNEWTAIMDTITSLIAKAKNDYAGHIEHINNGKPLATLSRIAVPKPPPPPAIIKVPPIVSVEPTKPAPNPGVIGSRPQYSGNNNISPGSRAPSSPIQKPNNEQSSPVRHLGAIGTRPNGVPVSTSSSSYNNDRNDSNSTGMSNTTNGLLKNFPWSDTLANINENVTPSVSSDMLSHQQQQSRIDHNGWDEQNMAWTNPLSSSMNHFQSMGQARSSSANQYAGWARQQTTPTSLPTSQDTHLQLSHAWRTIVNRLMVKLPTDQDTAIALAQSYIREQNVNILRVAPEDVADMIIQKRMADTGRLPPGAAPGYLQHPLMGAYNTPLGAMLGNPDNMLSSLLNGGLSDSPLRPSTSSDKWSSNGM